VRVRTACLWWGLLWAWGLAATAGGGLWNPPVVNPSLEDDVLAPATKTAQISGWWNRTAYCWASEETNASFPLTPYGANWAEFGNLSWMYQQIGTWQEAMEIEIDLLVGSVQGTDFPGLYVSLWVGGDPGRAADGNPAVVGQTTLETQVGAVAIATSELIKPADLYDPQHSGSYDYLGTGQTAEVRVVLSTGTGHGPGDPLWLLVQSAGRRRVLVDNIQVTPHARVPKAHNPVPAVNTEGVDPMGAFRWDVADASDPSFDVNIGTTPACDDVLVGQPTGGVRSYQPPDGLLDYGRIYYWRVDVTDGGTEYMGDVWQFGTGGKATNPVPPDGETADWSVGTLSWSGDGLISSYDVYFGRPGDLRFVGRYTVPAVSFDDLATALGQSHLQEADYQWRVDTRDAAGDLMAAGEMWAVTIPEPEAIVIDDFSYASSVELQSRWSTRGAATVVLDDIFGSMQLDFEGTPGQSAPEAVCVFDAPQDWASALADTLTVGFRGLPDNVRAPLVLRVGDGTSSVRMVHPDPEAVVDRRWRTWNLRLGDLRKAGLDLTHVAWVSIGIGMPNETGGTGTLLVDDLVLRYAGCIPDFKPAGDMNGDCRVGLDDLIALAGHWLRADFFVTGRPPDSDRLVAYYPFDTRAGAVTPDAGPNHYDALVAAADPNAAWDPGGYEGGCVRLDRATTLTLPAELFSGVNQALTITFWAAEALGDCLPGASQMSLAVGPTDPSQDVWDTIGWTSPRPECHAGWRHYAAVKDATVGELRLYRDGLLVARTEGGTKALEGWNAGDTVISLGPAILGPGRQVRIDELRIYGRALSQAEIVHLAEVTGGGLVQPIETIYVPRDPNHDGQIDLGDLALIARDWLRIR